MSVRPARPGAALRELREERGWTQSDLASRSGVNLAVIRDLEQGRTRRPRREAALALARALALSAEQAAALMAPPRPRADSADDGARVSLEVLGPLVVRRGRVPLELPTDAARVIHRLGLTPGVPVSEEALAELTDEPVPVTIAALHRTLGTDLIIDSEAGYELHATPDTLDLARFRELAAAGRWAEAARLWQGGPGLPAGDRSPELARLVAALREEYAGVLLSAARTAREAADRAAVEAVLPALRALAADLPLHEPAHAELIRTLAASGRQAEALATYDAVRTRLSEDLGLDPSPVLTGAYGSILGSGQPTVPVESSAPRQVPAPPAILVGRESEIDRLTASLDPSRPGPHIVLVTGPGGSGKTALALAAASRLSLAYPDGQLYADLYDVPDDPADPTGTTARFLRALGVPPRGVPTDPAEADALLRTRLAGRRLLIVLDSARSSDQVLRLLAATAPSSGECGVIVTTRNRLPDLATRHDLVRLDLDTLTPDAAVDLLSALIGDDRPARDPDAAVRLVDACDRLPLAIRIAAARLASRPHQSLARFAERLSDTSRRIDELSVGTASIAATFQLSYDALDPAHQRAFRLGALLPGPHFGADTAAAVLDVPVSAALDLLDDLVDAHMIEIRDPAPLRGSVDAGADRYGYHDLLRLYADRLGRQDPEWDPARQRMVSYYLHHVAAASELAAPGSFRASPAPADGTQLFADRHLALAWLDVEEEGLEMLIEEISDIPTLREQTWRIVEQLPPLQRWRTVDVGLRLVEAGLRAAAQEPRVRCVLQVARAELLSNAGTVGVVDPIFDEASAAATAGDWPLGRAYVLAVRGAMDATRGRFEAAKHRCQEALAMAPGSDQSAMAVRARATVGLAAIAGLSGDRDQAAALAGTAMELHDALGDEGRALVDRLNVANMRFQLGELDLAATLGQEALAMARRRSDLRGEAQSRSLLSDISREAGDNQAALDHARQALDLAVLVGDTWFEGDAVRSLGYTLLADGELDEAYALFDRGIEMAREVADRHGEADGTIGMASTQLALGDPVEARTYAERALAIAKEQGFGHFVTRAEQILDGTTVVATREPREPR